LPATRAGLQVTAVIVWRGIWHGSGLGVCLRLVEGVLAVLHWFGGLRVRWEIRDGIHHVFRHPWLHIICWRRLFNHSRCQEYLGEAGWAQEEVVAGYRAGVPAAVTASTKRRRPSSRSGSIAVALVLLRRGVDDLGGDGLDRAVVC
jgi:hypothetical protein